LPLKPARSPSRARYGLGAGAGGGWSVPRPQRAVVPHRAADSGDDLRDRLVPLRLAHGEQMGAHALAGPLIDTVTPWGQLIADKHDLAALSMADVDHGGDGALARLRGSGGVGQVDVIHRAPRGSPSSRDRIPRPRSRGRCSSAGAPLRW